MSKNYFDNILDDDEGSEALGTSSTLGRGQAPSTGGAGAPDISPGEKSIRNISVPQRRSRVGSGDVRVPPQVDEWRERSLLGQSPQKPKKVWLWIGAALSLAVLAILGLFAFRSTSISVIPTSEAVTLDPSTKFVLAPEAGATSTPAYGLETGEFEESAVVTSRGTETVSERAKGNATIYNAHSASPVRLIKNTRLETPDGLIFRIPEEVTVPGEKGTAPGALTVSVVADQPGEKYNVGPIAKFTLPGLKTSGSMFKNVYAGSTAPMAGGFVGTRAAVSESDLASARADIRNRLEKKARESAEALSTDSTIVFPDLVRISYEAMPQTKEAGDSVRVREKARVEIPVISAEGFARYIAALKNIPLADSGVHLYNARSLVASRDGAPDAQLAGQPLAFTLSGSAVLVWEVDASALATALAGKKQTEFETIIAGIPQIAEARARIQPFWKNSFPADASDIRVKIQEPKKK